MTSFVVGQSDIREKKREIGARSRWCVTVQRDADWTAEDMTVGCMVNVKEQYGKQVAKNIVCLHSRVSVALYRAPAMLHIHCISC